MQNKMINFCGGGAGVHYTSTKTILGIAHNSGGPEQEHHSTRLISIVSKSIKIVVVVAVVVIVFVNKKSGPTKIYVPKSRPKILDHKNCESKKSDKKKE